MADKNWNGYGQTDVGSVREENQDSLAVLDHSGVWCVADGMGGHKEGGIASHLVTQSLESLQQKEPQSLDELLTETISILQEANQALCDMSDSFYGEDLIGTTVVALLVRGDRGAVVWVGDSRLYRMRETAFEMVTRDHTQFEELVSRGLIEDLSSEKTHPASHMLTRALGVSRELNLDTIYLELEPGDRFLLCSDGLSNVIEQLDLGKAIYYSEDKQRAVANLINMALARQANDNVTALIVDRM
ncbi:PP2C family serine/threonine-protein phosphatase [Neptunomonas phycophila]|mgnify:FL=1|jgi:serine/threonine protein phosphatase PrpC|uniref:PP2C family protein-serine/threonine phosphatase n=1 Tax=Neptunomonas TaxID=75687 RepID=UPI0015BF8E6E|nr:protein phosphatase 2C domain-containing protein [Neptunomonas phycophila]MDO6467411.1 protein phosphatase 2C domain-containing protein [Neptunomonas phycophila]QLE97086.1 serine/threonine-protein phosphatase [Neptunomonas phycophila]